MRIKLLSSVVFASCSLCVVLVGCGTTSNAGRETNQPPAPPPSAVAPGPSPSSGSAGMQSSEFGLANVKLGDSADTVQQKLGEPSEVSVLHGVGIPLWVYQSQGLEIAFSVENSKPGQVVRIRATRPFAGKTSRGITIGSPKDDVVKSYGASYVKAGQDSLEFVIQDGKVAQIIIQQAL